MPAIDSTSFVSPNHSSRDGHAVKLILLHATVGNLLSALRWLINPQPDNPKDRVSSHFVIAKDGRIFQLVPLSEAAWHAGKASWQGETDVNEISISIELENANDGRDPYPPAQLDSCRWLCRDLLAQYQLTPADIATHAHVALPAKRKTDPAGFPFLDFVQSLGTPPTPRYTENAPLLAPCAARSFSRATAAMLTRIDPALPANKPAFGGYSQNDLFITIMPAYWRLATRVGLDPVLPWSQVLHETGWLTSWWVQRPRRNPAGIGVNGDTSATVQVGAWTYNTDDGLWHAGLSFPTWADHAIPAHLGRLLGYALVPDQMNATQQALYEQATDQRPLPAKVLGSALTLKRLGQAHNPSGLGWAKPGTDYGIRLAALANLISEDR